MPSSKLPRLLWSIIDSFWQQFCKRYFSFHPCPTNFCLYQLTLPKSIGCVNVCPSTNPDPSQPDNPGLMQSDGGATFVGNSASDSSQQSSITQMVIDGTQGTSLGDGLVQCINQYGNIYEVSHLLKVISHRFWPVIIRPPAAITRAQLTAEIWTTARAPQPHMSMILPIGWLAGSTLTASSTNVKFHVQGIFVNLECT